MFVSAYFGKYLNRYDGKRVPPGWNEWSGLVRNSRYYNYTLNINGKLERHGNDPEKDYFTNVITQKSIDYFEKQTQKNHEKPLFMVVAHAAPHGPEDGAPKYQKYYPDAKAPRFCNFSSSQYCLNCCFLDTVIY